MKPTRLLCTLIAGAASVLAMAMARPAAAAPVTALVMPFDATPGSVSFLIASHPARTGLPGGVRTHWAFWDEACTHLLDAIVCLPADGSVVVDPTTVAGAGSAADVGGHRGFVTVTAYEVAGACDAAQEGRGTLARDALLGSFTLADTGSGVSFGGAAIALPADGSGAFVDLPGGDPGLADPDRRQAALLLQTFAPARLDVSRVILLALQERGGSGAFRAVEPGPAAGGNDLVRAALRYADKDGSAISLPDVAFGCTAFTSLRAGDVPTLLAPGGPGDGIASGGFVALENPRIGERTLGGTTWLYGFHAQAVGTFGVLAVGDATAVSRSQPTPSATADTPTPRPSVAATARPSPTPSPTPSPAPSPRPSASAPATPGGSATPRPTGSLVPPTASPAVTPTGSSSTTPSPSPTSGPIPTGGATPIATATPRATFSPRPSATAAVTPGPTPTGARTPAPTTSPPPATATPAGCTTVTVQVRTAYGPSGPADISGVIATVDYPGTVTIPGSGGASSVLGRVSNVSGASGLFSATDTDSALRAGLISVSAAIPQGPFVRIVFDCVGGAVPQPGAFGCVLEASTLGGALVPGAACTTEIIP